MICILKIYLLTIIIYHGERFTFVEVICHDVAACQGKKAEEAQQKVVSGTFSHPETFPQFEQFTSKSCCLWKNS